MSAVTAPLRLHIGYCAVAVTVRPSGSGGVEGSVGIDVVRSLRWSVEIASVQVIAGHALAGEHKARQVSSTHCP